MPEHLRGVLRLPLVPDGAVGRPGGDRVHRRPRDRRDARPQRPAPRPLAGDQGRLGRARAPRPACSTSRPRTSLAQGPPAAGQALPRRPRRRAGSSPTRRSSARSPRRQPVRRVVRAGRRPPRRPARAPAARAARRAAAHPPARVRLHAGGPARPARRRWRPRREEPIGSMGNDLALAVLSDQAPPLFAYFKQLFAQVTNPPIDPIREDDRDERRAPASAPSATCSTRRPSTPTSSRSPQPILRNARAREAAPGRLVASSARTRSTITWPVADGPDGHGARASSGSAREAAEAIADGANILILSDRGVGAERAPIPSLLAVAAVHHHLVREGTRLQAGLVLESGEPREVHHFATLIGYGAVGDQPVPDARVARRAARDGRLPDGIDARARPSATSSRRSARACSRRSRRWGSRRSSPTAARRSSRRSGSSRELIDAHFTGTASRIGGIGLDVLAREALDAPRARATRDDARATCCPSAASTRGAATASTTCGTRSDRAAAARGPPRRPRRPTRSARGAINEDAARRATLRGLLEFQLRRRTAASRSRRSSRRRRSSSASPPARCRSARSRARRTRRSRSR